MSHPYSLGVRSQIGDPALRNTQASQPANQTGVEVFYTLHGRNGRRIMDTTSEGLARTWVLNGANVTMTIFGDVVSVTFGLEPEKASV